jgi:hypothetical protein
MRRHPVYGGRTNVMSRKRILAGAACIVLAVAFGYAMRARASGIPPANAMTYAGTLEDGNGPVTGMHNVQVILYDAPAAGNKLCESPTAPVTVTAGHFAAPLPDACTAAVGANQNVWVDVLVDGSDTGRTKAGAVPYAVEANHASATDDLAMSAERTGEVPPNQTAWTTIPGLSLSFTLARASLVEMTGNGVQRTVDASASTSCQAGYRYVVDGTARGDPTWGERVHVSNGASSLHSTWSVVDAVALGPGPHTVALQTINRSPAGNCHICADFDGTLAGYDSCRVNVTAIPQ